MSISRWIASWGEGEFTATDHSEHVVVMLHGFGSSPDDLAGLGKYFDPGTQWVALQATGKTPYGGNAWFPITSPGTPDPAPVHLATQEVLEWIESHIPPSAEIVALGFSQGGLMASQLLRHQHDRFAGLVILGGFVMQGSEPDDAQLAATTPLAFYGRGLDDHVIATHAIERTLQWLPTHTESTIRTYPELGHAVSPDEIADVVHFVRHAFARADTERSLT